ncbi:MAG: hypothetical protein WCG13_16450 [Burkholderiales bacterium]
MPPAPLLTPETPEPIPAFWYRWLQAVTAGTILFGLAMALLPEPTRHGFSLLVYGEASALAAFGPGVQPYLMLAHGVMGSVMVGWGLALWLTLRGPFRRGERHGWDVFVISLAGWFVPDTTISLWTGLWPNAVLNVAFALAFGVPLLACRSRFGAR